MGVVIARTAVSTIWIARRLFMFFGSALKLTHNQHVLKPEWCARLRQATFYILYSVDTQSSNVKWKNGRMK